jgi:hypothetical protein
MRRNDHVAFVIATLMLTATLPGFCQNAATQNTHAVKANIQQPAPQVPPAELRDPFTPVDIPPPPIVQTPIDNNPPVPGDNTPPPPPPPPPVATWPKLPIKALMTDPSGKHVAMIEGVGSVEAGDIVSRKAEGVIYRWRIEAITDKDVSFKKLDARPADATKEKDSTPQAPSPPPLPVVPTE